MPDWFTIDIEPLLVTAMTIGVVHTLLGADHYLPFIVIARERNWSNVHTLSITACCGIGHCLGSVALGFIGIATGIAIGDIEALESERGVLTAWLLIGFGIAYASWCLKKGRRNRQHRHRHVHADGTVHTHSHCHSQRHMHTHNSQAAKPLLVTLFIVFLLGPCEPLVPLLMYPAAQSNFIGVAAVTAAFCTSTIVTMMLAVAVGIRSSRGRWFPLAPSVSGAITGSVISLCGLGILVGF